MRYRKKSLSRLGRSVDHAVGGGGGGHVLFSNVGCDGGRFLCGKSEPWYRLVRCTYVLYHTTEMGRDGGWFWVLVFLRSGAPTDEGGERTINK